DSALLVSYTKKIGRTERRNNHLVRHHRRGAETANVTQQREFSHTFIAQTFIAGFIVGLRAFHTWGRSTIYGVAVSFVRDLAPADFFYLGSALIDNQPRAFAWAARGLAASPVGWQIVFSSSRASRFLTLPFSTRSAIETMPWMIPCLSTTSTRRT